LKIVAKTGQDFLFFRFLSGIFQKFSGRVLKSSFLSE